MVEDQNQQTRSAWSGQKKVCMQRQFSATTLDSVPALWIWSGLIRLGLERECSNRNTVTRWYIRIIEYQFYDQCLPHFCGAVRLSTYRELSRTWDGKRHSFVLEHFVALIKDLYVEESCWEGFSLVASIPGNCRKKGPRLGKGKG